MPDGFIHSWLNRGQAAGVPGQGEAAVPRCWCQSLVRHCGECTAQGTQNPAHILAPGNRKQEVPLQPTPCSSACFQQLEPKIKPIQARNKTEICNPEGKQLLKEFVPEAVQICSHLQALRQGGMSREWEAVGWFLEGSELSRDCDGKRMMATGFSHPSWGAASSVSWGYQDRTNAGGLAWQHQISDTL